MRRLRQLTLLLVLSACSTPARVGPPALSDGSALSLPTTKAALPSATPGAAVAPPRPVILATQRDQRLQVFDAATLAPLGTVRVHNLAHHVSASPDGQTLFLSQAATPDGRDCCALFALRLPTGELCPLLEPTLASVVSPTGQQLFSQRGNGAIEVIDARTLRPEPPIPARSLYQLLPSPDGRWLAAVSWSDAALDLFDLQQRALVRRLPLPHAAAAWLGDQLYVYAHDGTHGTLRTVTSTTTALPAPQTVALPRFATGGQPIYQVLLAAGERLLLYIPLGRWLTLNPRQDYGAGVPGGIFAIEPTSGTVLAHLAPTIDFAQVVASSDGRHLYALEAGTADGQQPVRLLILDAMTGAVVQERALADDVWSITAALLPDNLIPRAEVHPIACGS